ncbi:MAG: exodeoxyribonuclease III [Candidatus Omnitrophota bacterium]|jgi:exodeoxyribonuclease-3|nr:MAG: exodeoxyribonuclease III [Candidatus Omnitrophota bacterium]
MKFISWNVNGIRAVLNKGFLDFVNESKPDILCLQEMRALPDQVDLPMPGYHRFWNPAEKKGYSGVAIFTRKEPLHVVFGMNIPAHDREGRMITLEFKDYHLVNVYTPNSQRGLERLAYRTQEWDVAFLAYLKNLETNKPVIFCGDLNVAHKEIDLANPKANERNAGFTIEERQRFDCIMESGFIDTFREFTKEGGHYSWWSYFGKAREKNVGWRIDYFCISPALRPRLKTATILPDVMGSDHCPVVMNLK